MGRKKKSEVVASTEVATVVNVDKVEAGKPVDAADVVSLADINETTPAAETAKDANGVEVVKANPALGIASDLPTIWIKPEEALVEFDTRGVANPGQAVTDQQFAISIYLYGQKQPAIGYYDDIDNRLVLTTGRTRQRAIKLLNAGFVGVDPRNGDTVTFHDPNRKLWVAIEKQKSKEDQFVGDLETQLKSNKFTDYQEALAVQTLQNKFSWSLTDIASLFGKNNTNRVAKLLKLLELEENIKLLVHEGKLSLDAALTVAGLKPQTREVIIRKATNDESGEVNGSLIKELVRDIYSAGDADASAEKTGSEGESGEGDDEGEGGKPKGVSLARNVAKFKAFVASIVDDEETEFGQPTKDLLNGLLRWFEGTKFGDTALKNKLRETVKSKYGSKAE